MLCIYDSQGRNGVVCGSLQHRGWPGGVHRVLSRLSRTVTWGTVASGESGTSCLGKHHIPLPCVQPHGLHTQKHMDGTGQFIHFPLLKVSFFMFKYFRPSHPHWLFGTCAKMKGMKPYSYQCHKYRFWRGKKGEMELICIRNCLFDTVVLCL